MNWQTFRLRALWCWHQLLTLALIALVLVAVLVGVARQFLPTLDQYRPRLEAELSAAMGLPVRLAGLEGVWEGFGLKLQLHDLQLRDPALPETVLLRIPEVELRPALWQSLRHFEPRVDVRLSGLDIHLDQLDDGSVKLRELAGLSGSNPEAAEQALRFALRQPALAVSASRVGLALKGRPELTLSDIDLVNINQGDRHQLAGNLRVPGSLDTLGLQLELTGDPLRWQESELRVWLHLPVLPLEPWLPLPDAHSRGLRTLTGGGDYWLHFRAGQLAAVQGKLDWRELVLEAAGRQHQLQNLKGELAWSRTGDGAWQLAASGLRGAVDGLPWPLPQVALRGQAGALEIALARADIGPALRLLEAAPLPAKLAGWLQQARPEGRLTSMRAALQQDVQAGWQLQWLDASVAALAATATPSTPGGRGLAAWLRWTPETTWLGLQTREAELDLAQIFRERIAVQELSGHLRLQQHKALWLLDSDRLQLRNPDARGSAVFSLALPPHDPAAARLSLLAGIQEARAASTWRYVPWPAAGDKTLAWLREAILDGKVSQGDFLYEGPVSSRADLGPHRMLMRFALAGGRLRYDSHWPEIRQVDAEVTLDGNSLSVIGSSLQTLDESRGRQVRATIADLHKPVLEIDGDISSTGRDVMRLFRESALKAHVAGLGDALDMDGPVQGRLQLSLPLLDGEPEVEVSALLADNRLRVREAELDVSALSGALTFSSRAGLEAPALKARLLEAPVSINIGSQMRRGALAAVNVDVAGQAGVPALRRWLGSNLLDVASGTLNYQARITLPTDASAARLQLDSTLAGLRLDLPPPFGKAAAESVALHYQSALGKGEQMARLQYGQRLAAGLVWEGGRLDRALLRLSGTSPAWPQQAGIEVEGSLPRLDVAVWMPWIQRFGRSAPASTVAVRGATPLPALGQINIRVGEVLVEGMRLPDAQISLQRRQEAWQLALSAEPLAGQLLIPDAGMAELKLDFSRLQWPLPHDPAVAETTASNALPAALPGLGNRSVRINGEGLRLTSLPGLGLVGVSARLLPSPYGLRVEDIVIDSSVLDFQGRLDWQWRGGMSTRLRGTASSSNVGGLLSALGYAPSLVSPKAGADIDLAWPGSPEKPVLAGLEGKLALSVEQGRLLTISNTTSASRVFGWFDVDNIKRRFKGDFSDVMRRGLSFDKASLSGPLQAGVMAPADFRVDGPSLKAEGHGQLDLARQQMDQQFTVTVPVSSAVPVAAVVVAGPLIGGAVAAAQMAFERQLDKVTQLRYHVSGNWADPTVERVTMKVLQGKAPAASPLQPVADSKGGKP